MCSPWLDARSRLGLKLITETQMFSSERLNSLMVLWIEADAAAEREAAGSPHFPGL